MSLDETKELQSLTWYGKAPGAARDIKNNKLHCYPSVDKSPAFTDISSYYIQVSMILGFHDREHCIP